MDMQVCCSCRNTCGRSEIGKRGRCPCRSAGQNCDPLHCQCGTLVGCTNLEVVLAQVASGSAATSTRDGSIPATAPSLQISIGNELKRKKSGKIAPPSTQKKISTEIQTSTTTGVTNPKKKRCKTPHFPKMLGSDPGKSIAAVKCSKAAILNTLDAMAPAEVLQFAKDFALRNVEAADELLSVHTNRDPPSGPPPAADCPWCVCSRCRPMPTARENVCCRLQHCVTMTDQFQYLCLEGHVLILTMRLRNEFFGVPEVLTNDNYRFAAYGNYTLWHLGRLGVGNRVVIPSCVVLSIRNAYPSPDNTYRGFIPGNTPD